MATRGLASTRRRGQHLFGDFPVRNIHVCGSNTFVGAAGAIPIAK
jgi:hypothetical protein